MAVKSRKLLARTFDTAQFAKRCLARNALSRFVDRMKELDVERIWTVVLHDVFGYDLPEVARVTGVTLTDARSRLERGRRVLHRWIREDPELADFFRQADTLR